MRWPGLVREANTPIAVELRGPELSADGAQSVALTFTALANWQGRHKVTRDRDGVERMVAGVALIPGDPCPNLAEIGDGTVAVDGGRPADLLNGQKVLNPDGSVNYTRLEVGE